MRRAARLFFRLTGIPLKVEGTTAGFAARAVVAANHASYLDGLVLAAALPGEPAFVAKNELAGQFFAGRFLHALGAIFVERDDPEGGVGDTRRALAACRAGRSLAFFPEGTFTRAPGLLPFRLGAFLIAAEAGLPVLPVAIYGTRSVLRGDQWLPRRGAVTVHCGDPVVPDGADFAAAVRLRNAVRAVILRHCGEPDLAEGA